MAWFSLRRRRAATAALADQGGRAGELADLGAGLMALRLDGGEVAPPGTVVVVFDAAGQARRAPPGKVACAPGQTAFCFHPGPYTLDLIPFAAAPEWGLRLRFVVDAAYPHVAQQRFDLYLYAEVAPDASRLPLAAWSAAVQATLQNELAQGALELPPCTALDEWHAFRAGLNQLLYTRYGVTVDDCLPVDLGGQVDFAQVLQERAAQASAQLAAMAPVADVHSISALPPAAAPAAAPAAIVHSISALPPAAAPADAPAAIPATAATAASCNDAAGLRRLFLELPVLTRDLRVLALPVGPAAFQQHQGLLHRLGMASLHVDTMPALAWTAPDQPLDAFNQARRAGATALAVTALDQCWSLLARLQRLHADERSALFDDADRLCANLETGLAQRRATHVQRQEPLL